MFKTQSTPLIPTEDVQISPQDQIQALEAENKQLHKAIATHQKDAEQAYWQIAQIADQYLHIDALQKAKAIVEELAYPADAF